MGAALEIAADAPPALFDGAVALALATGARLELVRPPRGADAAILLAAAQLSSDPGSLGQARALLAGDSSSLLLARPRAGSHALELADPGAVQRAAVSLCWPLALLGRPSELVLRGPNHGEGPAFHELRLGWPRLARAFGLRVRMELHAAAFPPGRGAPVASGPGAPQSETGPQERDAGELLLALDPGPALTALLLPQRGLLSQALLVAASESGASGPAYEAAEACRRRLRLAGIAAEIEQVPLPLAAGAMARGGWALSAALECEHATVAASVVGMVGEPGAVADAAGTLVADAAGAAESAAGKQLAERLIAWVESGGALDGPSAERALLPAILCAAGLGARAGAPPGCTFTTSEVTPGLLALAQLAHRAAPVRAVVDGEPGGEGRVVVAPAAPAAG